MVKNYSANMGMVHARGDRVILVSEFVQAVFGGGGEQSSNHQEYGSGPSRKSARTCRVSRMRITTAGLPMWVPVAANGLPRPTRRRSRARRSVLVRNARCPKRNGPVCRQRTLPRDRHWGQPTLDVVRVRLYRDHRACAPFHSALDRPTGRRTRCVDLRRLRPNPPEILRCEQRPAHRTNERKQAPGGTAINGSASNRTHNQASEYGGK